MVRKSFVKKCIKNLVIWYVENLFLVFFVNIFGMYRYSLFFCLMGVCIYIYIILGLLV